MPERPRQQNDHVRKLCECQRRAWSKCPHPWHFNFQHNGQHFRFSLDRQVGALVQGATSVNARTGETLQLWRRDRKSLGKPITTKSEAQYEAERLRAGIRDGSLLNTGADRPNRETLTLEQLIAIYRRDYLEVKRKDSLPNLTSQIRVILRTKLEAVDGAVREFGAWLVANVNSAAIEQFQKVRLPRGVVGANRDLSLLRAMFSWAVGKDHIERTPFKKNGEVVIRLSRETRRRRRLRPGEAEAILAACGPHLRAVVEAAIETGMRRGELLSLQWWQVRFEPKAEIMLPAVKTKTKADRTIPVSSRLKAILEMRRYDPAGEEQKAQAYVFGNEIGQRVKNFKRAWERALLVAHGYTPRYVVKVKERNGRQVKIRTAVLVPECRAALKEIDLHFHDLRREAGSRWLDGGVPLHRIKQWLGHANISQTSTYLEAEAADNDEAMRRFEARLQTIANAVQDGTEKGPLGQMTASENRRKPSQTHTDRQH